jgi:hypothetical protein
MVLTAPEDVVFAANYPTSLDRKGGIGPHYLTAYSMTSPDSSPIKGKDDYRIHLNFLFVEAGMSEQAGERPQASGGLCG